MSNTNGFFIKSSEELKEALCKNEEELLLKEWQARLGLQDWVIRLNYNCVFGDMKNEEVQGETEFDTSIKCATIRIMNPKEIEDRLLRPDFEYTLIHELLHLKFGLIDGQVETYDSYVAYEVRHQLIDDLARALVMAKRGTIDRDRPDVIIEDMNSK